MASRKRSMSNDSDVSPLFKEWDEVSCPICMDHPHNAVLLICSSYNNGCRSYICDTSYRHSNCLDRFKKLKEENADTSSPPEIHPNSVGPSTSTFNLETWISGLPGVSNSGSEQQVVEDVEKSEEGLNLRCPLCRGSVLGWKVDEGARKYLNLKYRTCSSESCTFTGNYRELRSHARRIHPTVRPADIDPSRQRAWRRLEDQREYSDIVSAIHSAMPGAVVFGDYVIENGDRIAAERERGGGRWLSTFFLFHMIGSMESGGDLRGGRARVFPRHRRAGGNLSRRRYLWGENLLGLQNDDDDEDEENEDGEQELNVVSDHGNDVGPMNPRRRRRLSRGQADGDQQ